MFCFSQRRRLSTKKSERMWAALMIPTFLFLSLFSVGCAQEPVSTTDGSDNYPILWDQISGSITEFPVQNNKIIIDIWKYADRLKMYKILMRESDKYFAQFGKNNSENVLWALTIFYGRLYKTGMYILIIPKEACFSLLCYSEH